METKICIKCNEEKVSSEFRVRDGYLRHDCRKCESKARRGRAYSEPSDEAKERYKETNREYHRRIRRDSKYRARNIWNDSRRYDKVNGLDHTLSVQDIQELLDCGCCTYCGETELVLTLDRIDNTVGHIASNVIVACYRCNLIRRDMTYDAWMNIVPSVRDTREKGLFGEWTGGVQKVIHKKLAASQGVEPCQP